MNTASALIMGERNRNKEPMVFNWVKAAILIATHDPVEAKAGLLEDYEYTMGTIWRDGEIVTNEYTYLASTWATPISHGWICI